MTCKDCLHFDVCKDATVPNPEYKGEQPDMSKECRHFKNKADYVAVKHGRWKTVFVEHGYHKECSICGAVWMLDSSKHICIETDYCYKCGAKMDGGSDT